MNTRISGLCAVAALALAVSPALSAERNINNPSGKASAADVSPQAITTSSASQIFIPITPCRAFGGQAISTPNTSKDFFVAGAVNMTAQGGPAGGCGVPANAIAVSFNLSAGVSTAQGFLTAFQTGTTRPNMASLNYKTNPATSGSIVVLGTSGKITVFASSATRVSGDITGYFLPAVTSASIFGADGTVNRGEGVDTNASATSRLSTGTYQVGFTRDITECFFQVTAGEGGIGSATPRTTGVTRRSGNPNGVFVRITDNTGASVDNDFFVTVSCGK